MKLVRIEQVAEQHDCGDKRARMSVLLTPEDIAARLKISRSTARRMLIENVIPAIVLRSGKRKKVFRCREEALERWLNARERQAAKEIAASEESRN